MLDLDKHEIKKVFEYPDSKDEWYEIKHIPTDTYSEYKKEGQELSDFDIFTNAIVTWGGVKAGSKELACNEDNKLFFFKAARDRVSWIFKISQNINFFAIDGEEFIVKMGEYLTTLKNGEKNNQNHITRVAKPV